MRYMVFAALWLWLKKVGGYLLAAVGFFTGWWLWRGERAKRKAAEEALRVQSDILARRVALEKELSVHRARSEEARAVADAAVEQATGKAAVEVAKLEAAAVTADGVSGALNEAMKPGN